MAQTYTVERSTTVPAPAADVYALLADFHRWIEWSPWEELDPDLRRTFSGADSGRGAVYEWSGNRKAGQGRMEITDAVPGERVAVDLRFEKPFRSENVTTFTLTPKDGATHVTWTMVGPRPLVMRLMGIFFSFEKVIGNDFDKGLAKLRTAAGS